MKDCRIVAADTGRTLVERARVAFTARERMLGLLGRKELPAGQGLLISGCWSVHMFFMRFAIDVVYISGDDVVLKIVPALKPWRTSACWRAHSVLEVPAGWASQAGIAVGQALAYQSLDAPA